MTEFPIKGQNEILEPRGEARDMVAPPWLVAEALECCLLHKRDGADLSQDVAPRKADRFGS
ncbi:hypothetical protein BGX87_26015 [Burkholderia ubonensis]|nr:hypothetical protein BGX87_26015 [Burkholderia ubonensis]